MQDVKKPGNVDNHLVITVIDREVLDVKQLPTYNQAVKYANAMLIHRIKMYEKDPAELIRGGEAALVNSKADNCTCFNGWANVNGGDNKIDVFVEPTKKSIYDAKKIEKAYAEFLEENPDIKEGLKACE